MFIDPEPRTLRQSASSTNVATGSRSGNSRPTSRSTSRPTSAITEVAPLSRPLRASRHNEEKAGRRGSGFFSSQTPRDALRDERWRVKKKILHERHSSKISTHSLPRPSTSGTGISEGQIEDVNHVRLSKPTIRLVGETPEPPRTDAHEERRPSSRFSKLSEYLDEERAWREKYRHSATPDKLRSLSDEQSQQANSKPASPRSPSAPGFPASRQERAGFRVSGSDWPANRVSQDDQAYNNAMQAKASTADPSSGFLHLNFASSSSLHPQSANDSRSEDVPHRRDNSNSTFLSDVTTLLGNDSAILLGLGPGTDTTRSRLSDGTTLRGTPTPWEQEHPDYIDEVALPQRSTSVSFLPPLRALQEQSSERQTVRLVAPSEKSLPSLPPDSRPVTGASTSLPDVNLPTAPVSSSSSEEERLTLRQARTPQASTSISLPKRSLSQGRASYVPQPLTVRKVSASPAQRPETGNQSVATTYNLQSSPNLVTYSPTDSDRQRSVSHPLRSEASIASLNSILQYPAARAASQPLHLSYSIESIASQIARSTTQRSLAESSSFGTLPSESSRDTVPSLKVPKKRFRHKAKGRSFDSVASNSKGRMDAGNYDVEVYGRHQFSSHLSTIASESERSGSRHLSSHFSLGSGVLTGDDASGDWSRYRRSSIPVTSTYPADGAPSPNDGPSGVPSPYATTSSSDEPGDMTLGIFRAESAKPEPLRPYQNRANPLEHSKRYDGPLPPLPPVPKDRDSEERIDTLSELSSPALRPMRSGYSLRRRSNSTPSHSRQLSQVSYVTIGSERHSGGNTVFPTWARHFYSGTAHLLSASKISLAAPYSPPKRPALGHSRTGSTWTERSITSRLGTGYSHIEETPSPSSSHFLPSIFRPRTRPRAITDGTVRLPIEQQTPGNLLTNKTSSGKSVPDSMAISEAPLPVPSSFDASRTSEQQNNDLLPSGQPRWGDLQDESATPTGKYRPLRKSQGQKKWDEMQYPHTMSRDRLSDLPPLPNARLPPTRRSGASSHGISVWRAPSFVESLDTLFKSRCNRQILLFALGFCCPLLWMLAAVLPLPQRPLRESGLFEKSPQQLEDGQREEDAVSIAMKQMEQEAGGAFAERRWHEDRTYLKARWWRNLNRIMSVVGLGIIAAIIALVVVATT